MSIVYGVHSVLEVLRTRSNTVTQVYVTSNCQFLGEVCSRARDARLRIQTVDRSYLNHLAAGGVHQGVAARIREFEYTKFNELLALAQASDRTPFIVALDGIQDPHNLGAIIRSAHAFGAHGVVVTKDRAVSITAVVMKTSAGATAHCPISRVTNLSRAIEAFKKAGLWVVAAHPTSKETLWESKLYGPIVVVVGAEGHGIRKGILKHCDFTVRIPIMGQIASLNASVSAGVVFAEVSRQCKSHANAR